MRVEVDYLQVQDESEDFLDRVEKGETFVVTEGGRPIADLIPHQEETRRHVPGEVE